MLVSCACKSWIASVWRWSCGEQSRACSQWPGSHCHTRSWCRSSILTQTFCLTQQGTRQPHTCPAFLSTVCSRNILVCQLTPPTHYAKCISSERLLLPHHGQSEQQLHTVTVRRPQNTHTADAQAAVKDRSPDQPGMAPSQLTAAAWKSPHRTQSYGKLRKMSRTPGRLTSDWPVLILFQKNPQTQPRKGSTWKLPFFSLFMDEETPGLRLHFRNFQTVWDQVCYATCTAALVNV